MAARAAICATPADLAAMDQCLADMAQGLSFVQWKRLDDKLHRTVAEATHNGLLLLLYDTLRSQIKLSLDARLEDVFGATTGPLETSDAGHRSFVEAIRKHDPERAEGAMRDHLQTVRVMMFGLR